MEDAAGGLGVPVAAVVAVHRNAGHRGVVFHPVHVEVMGAVLELAATVIETWTGVSL